MDRNKFWLAEKLTPWRIFHVQDHGSWIHSTRGYCHWFLGMMSTTRKSKLIPLKWSILEKDKCALKQPMILFRPVADLGEQRNEPTTTVPIPLIFMQFPGKFGKLEAGVTVFKILDPPLRAQETRQCLSRVSAVRFMPCQPSVASLDSGFSHQTLYHCVIIRKSMAAVNHHNRTSFINCQVHPSSGIATVSRFYSRTVF